MKNIFKKKDKTKTIKLSDLTDITNNYISIYNEIVTDIVSFLFDKCQNSFKNTYYSFRMYFKNHKLMFKLYTRDHEIQGDHIDKMITLYASEKLLKEIKFFESLGSIDGNILNNLEIKYQNYNINFNATTYKKYINPQLFGKDISYYKIENINDDSNIIKDLTETNPDITIHNVKLYEKLQKCIYEYNSKNIKLFDKYGNLYDKFKGKDIEDEILKNINFDNKNISGINISKCKKININFDKIVKDLSNSNISGYNLKNYTFRNFNLTNCNLSNTNATIDLATCVINKESKMEIGTIFDENNKFVFLNKDLSPEQVESLGIKIYKKER